MIHVMFWNTRVTVSHGSWLFVLVSGVVITHLYYQKSFASLRWSLSAAKTAVLSISYEIIVIVSLALMLFHFLSHLLLSCFSGVTVCL